MEKTDKDVKRQNSLIVWIIVAVIATIVFCYGFSVLYFYEISPNNISSKISVWPFLSDKDIGNMYKESLVEISFMTEDSEKSIVGVNVREDGYIVAPFDELRSCDENTQIVIKPESGKVYDGKILFGDMNYNLAILKCENPNKSAGVKLPFVKISNLFNLDSVICLESLNEEASFGEVTEVSEFPLTFSTLYNNQQVVDFVIENGVLLIFDKHISGGPVFDRNGGLLGFGYEVESGQQYVGNYLVPTKSLKLIINRVAKAYQQKTSFSKELVDSFVGFDKQELVEFHTMSNESPDYKTFFFKGKEIEYPESVEIYESSDLEGFFLLEDFNFKNTSISKDCVITQLISGENSVKVKNKLDLFDFVYSLSNGKNLEIIYQSLSNLGESSSVKVVV